MVKVIDSEIVCRLNWQNCVFSNRFMLIIHCSAEDLKAYLFQLAFNLSN